MYLVTEELIEKLHDRFFIERDDGAGKSFKVEITNIDQRNAATFEAIFVT